MKNAIMPQLTMPTQENALTDRANRCMEQDIYDAQLDINLAIMSGNHENIALARKKLNVLERVRDMPRHLFIGEYNERSITVDNIGLNIGLDSTQIDVLNRYYEINYNPENTQQETTEMLNGAIRLLGQQTYRDFSLTLDQICEMLHILRSTYEGQGDAPIPLYTKCESELDTY